jgi:hypothetical protein
MLEGARSFIVIKGVDKAESLIEELLGFRIPRGHRMVEVAQSSHERHGMTRSLMRVVLGRYGEATHSSAKNCGQSFHLVRSS